MRRRVFRRSVPRWMRAKLPGPGVHKLVSYLPLGMYRSYYDGEGAKDKPALKVPVTEENMTLSSAEPSHLLRCRLYHPQALTGSNAASPLVLFIHGGGFCMGSLESHQSSCRFIAAETGFRVFHYLPPRP
jgi:acetyl esterase/lipase